MLFDEARDGWRALDLVETFVDLHQRGTLMPTPGVSAVGTSKASPRVVACELQVDH
jgi:hypothetical protein